MAPVYFLYRWLSSRRMFYMVFCAFSLYWIADLFMQYFFLEFATKDTLIQAQPIIHWLKYDRYWLELLSMHPLYDHFYVGILMLTPLFYWVQTALWLPIAKVCSYLICPCLFFYYGNKHFKDRRWATVIPIWWFFQDIIMGSMIANSHVTGIALFLVVLAFFFALNKQFFRMWITLIILALFKEHLPLVWVSLGLFLIVEQGDRKQGVWLIGLGTVLGILIFFVAMPFFGQYTPDTPSIQHSKFGPWAHLDLKLIMIVKSLLPFGFIHLMRIRSMLYILPLFSVYLMGGFENSLWVRSYHHDIQQTWLMCLVFYLIKQCLDEQLAWPRILQRYPKQILTVFSVAVVGIGIKSLPIIQDYAGVPLSELKTRYQVTRAIQSVRHAIPEGVYIYTTEELGMFFADRYLGGINGDTLSQTRPHVIVYRPSSLYRYHKNFDYEGFHNQIQLAVRNQTLFQIDIAPDLMLVGNNVPPLTGFKNDIPAKGI